jgi:hypothetical protein
LEGQSMRIVLVYLSSYLSSFYCVDSYFYMSDITFVSCSDLCFNEVEHMIGCASFSEGSIGFVLSSLY